jgi:hypothetical protein
MLPDISAQREDAREETDDKEHMYTQAVIRTAAADNASIIENPFLFNPYSPEG